METRFGDVIELLLQRKQCRRADSVQESHGTMHAVELRRRHIWRYTMQETNGRSLYNIFIYVDIT
jgi:hypothetical protein